MKNHIKYEYDKNDYLIEKIEAFECEYYFWRFINF